MQSSFVVLNQVPTKIITWGKSIEDKFEENDSENLVICIPGIPGVTSFYYTFLETLYQQLGWPVWIVGHAGHEMPENQSLHNIPSLKENKECYNLEGQIKHKVEFFEKYVPKNVKVHLIGHSAGAFIITKLLKIPSIKRVHTKSYLMFPTLEYIADTPYGIFYKYFVTRILFLILSLSWLLSRLPYIIRYIIAYIYIIIIGADNTHTNTLCHFVHHKVLEKVFFMASDEMEKMKERENETIKDNASNIRLYFGSSDGWAPISYCDKLKQDLPDVNAEICQRKFTHAFVLKSSKDVGNMIAGWIKENM